MGLFPKGFFVPSRVVLILVQKSCFVLKKILTLCGMFTNCYDKISQVVKITTGN